MLAEHWVPQNVTVKCEDCGETLYDSSKHADKMDMKMDVARDIYSMVLKHNSEEDHWNFDMNITKKAEVTSDIEMNVTVGEKE